jgi:hypothetical protein
MCIYGGNTQLTQNGKRQWILPFQSELEQLTTRSKQRVHVCDQANTEGKKSHTTIGIYLVEL